MNYATYKLTNDEYAPSIVTVGKYSTPVWRQNRWDTGEFAQFIRGNGCGHCCAAMAARLNGVDDIDPYKEFELCRQMWGAPKEHQNNAMSIGGIKKVLNALNVAAECFGISENGAEEATEHIVNMLKDGKQVIIWSEPSVEYPYPENPFSKGAHYVLAAGIAENGKILIANSSEKWTAEGVQLVDAETVTKALYHGSNPAEDTTWIEGARMPACGGYVVVG